MIFISPAAAWAPSRSRRAPTRWGTPRPPRPRRSGRPPCGGGGPRSPRWQRPRTKKIRPKPLCTLLYFDNWGKLYRA